MVAGRNAECPPPFARLNEVGGLPHPLQLLESPPQSDIAGFHTGSRVSLFKRDSDLAQAQARERFRPGVTSLGVPAELGVGAREQKVQIRKIALGTAFEWTCKKLG